MGCTLAGYSAGYTGEPLWQDISRDLLASRSGGILGGVHWRAARRDTRDPLASSSGGILGRIHWRAALARYSAGSTGEMLWPRDPVTSPSGGILGGIHWRAALARYWAGCTGEQLERDIRRDPLENCSSGILGGGVV